MPPLLLGRADPKLVENCKHLCLATIRRMGIHLVQEFHGFRNIVSLWEHWKVIVELVLPCWSSEHLLDCLGAKTFPEIEGPQNSCTHKLVEGHRLDCGNLKGPVAGWAGVPVPPLHHHLQVVMLATPHLIHAKDVVPLPAISCLDVEVQRFLRALLRRRSNYLERRTTSLATCHMRSYEPTVPGMPWTI